MTLTAVDRDQDDKLQPAEFSLLLQAYFIKLKEWFPRLLKAKLDLTGIRAVRPRASVLLRDRFLLDQANDVLRRDHCCARIDSQHR